MLFNTFASCREDIQAAAAIPSIKEVLLEPMLLARQGTLTQQQLYNLAEEARRKDLDPVLVWDILMTDSSLNTVGDRVRNWDLGMFSAVRAADAGVAQWLCEHYPRIPLQLSVENGNHNLPGLLSWCDLFKASLSRLILSIELTEETLAEYCQALPIDCELLGAGRILLFYSPRELLSPVVPSPPQSPLIESVIKTKEYGSRAFPTQESIHGTLMYFDKDQFLLDRYENLKQCGFHTIRIDVRHFSTVQAQTLPLSQICSDAVSSPKRLKKQWPFLIKAPFFKSNRTASMFPRLKSKISPLKDTSCIAQCIGSKNGEYGIFQTLHPFNRDDVRQMILPTKVAVDIPEDVTFHTISGEELGECDANQTIIMSWIKRTASGSILVK
ncbi:MAG: U32 family peptidase [Cyanobacteria bacterium P01_F01_bin.42]